MSNTGINTLLLVEDDPIDVELFLRAAKKTGLETPVNAFPSGEEALTFLKDLKPTGDIPPVLVITDINMPGLNGHEVMEDVRKDPHLAETLFIMLSSSDQGKDISRAYRNGAIGYVIKGASTESITRCVNLVKAYVDTVALP